MSVSAQDAVPLPTADEQRRVTQAITSARARVTITGPSKFDWLFASARPRVAVFQVVTGSAQSWVDVHFMTTPVEGITACTGTTPSGESTFTVGLKGRPQVLGGSSATGYVSGANPIYFAASDDVFVMTPDAALRDAVARSLGLAVPSCAWREPATLPRLPWESEVVDALHASKIEVWLVGGSKFQTFLGGRRQARVFTAGSLTTFPLGVDVLYLDAPLRDLRMCSSPSSPGFTRWTVVVDGTSLPGMEGSQTAYPLIGPRFFVIAWDAHSARALADGLGLNPPSC